MQTDVGTTQRINPIPNSKYATVSLAGGNKYLMLISLEDLQNPLIISYFDVLTIDSLAHIVQKEGNYAYVTTAN
jgi:hypothetical protein